jgi:hypothetical protein
MEIKGIPTLYRGITFRSRLEAKWAAMFDRLEWRWEYEPIDLQGYIPDFVLKFHKDVLAEVKPAGTLTDCRQYIPKIARSGWTGEALIFGSSLKLNPNSFMGPTCCLYGQTFGPLGELSWGEAELFLCRSCGKYSIYHTELCYRCLVNGCYDGGSYISHVDFATIHTLWADAGEEVRYTFGEEAA